MRLVGRLRSERESRPEKRHIPPPPLFFGSVDSRRVKARFLRSVDSSRVEILQNEHDAGPLGSVDSRGLKNGFLRSVDSGTVRDAKFRIAFGFHE
jgi:hypothetical protein